jgi:Zn-dependent protease
VAFAGPLCNALLFLVLMPLLIGWEKVAGGTMDFDVYMNLRVFLYAGCAINLLLFFFNLIPVPPLDGSRIIGDFFPRFNELWRGRNAEMIAVVAFVGVFFFLGPRVNALAFGVTESVFEWGKGLLGVA